MLSNYDRPPIEKVVPRENWYGNMMKSYDRISLEDDALTKEITWKS